MKATAQVTATTCIWHWTEPEFPEMTGTHRTTSSSSTTTHPRLAPQRIWARFWDGTELVFRLHVNDTGYDYFSGPSSRNPDGKPHARVQDGWATDTTLVSFEDLFDTPEFPGGYNDLSFSFTNTRGVPVVPEASTVISGIGLAGLAGLAVYRRLRS